MPREGGVTLSAKCPDCGQTVNATKGQPVPIHRRRNENTTCGGTGEPAK